MENVIKNKSLKWFKFVPAVICIMSVILCLIFAAKADFEDVIAFTPENLFLAALVLWALYAVKSMSIIIPATIFFVAAGHLYPYWLAVVINIIGLSISFTIPYFVGRISGADAVEMITEKYPKAKKIISCGHDNNFFACYVSRAITVVPNDLVSILHGAIKMPYPSFLLGSVVGILPEMVVETYIGGQLSQLSLKSVAVMVGLILLTLLFSVALNKKISKIGKNLDSGEDI